MTQKQKVLNHLKNEGKLTQLEATMKYRILRLGAIINVLRKEGYEIVTHTPKDKGNYAIYELLGEKVKTRFTHTKKEEDKQNSLFTIKPKFKNAYDV
tara:strand:- start:13533 stop:13823 length:291 start_codon:yes stop_codon:yes gene_type:complete